MDYKHKELGRRFFMYPGISDFWFTPSAAYCYPEKVFYYSISKNKSKLKINIFSIHGLFGNLSI